MRKAAVRHGDPTTTGGTVMAFQATIFDDGKRIALTGEEATCGRCDGVFKIAGTGQGMSDNGRPVVVDGDLVLCPCGKNRVIVGANPGIFLEINSSASTPASESSWSIPTYIPPHSQKPMMASSLKETDRKSTLQDHPELICPNMTNKQFAELIMRLSAELVRRTQNRLGELQRWNTQDQRNVVTWFGVADHATRETLLDGLGRMLRVLKSLTPANFVRYSETALKHVGCVPRPGAEQRGVIAAVCKPDTENHTIAIALGFCTLRDDSDRVDSQILTLAHEISHFIDTLDTEDEEYRIWNAIALARAKSPICIKNADNVAAYIVVRDSNIPSNFGTSIIKF